MTRSTPGVTKASMLAALPDVGAGMDGRTVRFQMRFVRRVEEGGVVADRWDHSSHRVMQVHTSRQGWDGLGAASVSLSFPCLFLMSLGLAQIPSSAFSRPAQSGPLWQAATSPLAALVRHGLASL